MKERRIHYRPSRVKVYVQCGAVMKRNTESTVWLDEVTCRVCMFAYLAEQAPWAREFMDKLRGADTAAKRLAGARGQLEPISVPARLAEEMDRKVKRGGGFLGRTFRHERGSQKAISELLTQPAPTEGAIQPVMDYSGATALPVGVQPAQIAEQAGDRCQVSDKTGGDF